VKTLWREEAQFLRQVQQQIQEGNQRWVGVQQLDSLARLAVPGLIAQAITAKAPGDSGSRACQERTRNPQAEAAKKIAEAEGDAKSL